VIVGKGVIDFPALFRASSRINYTGHVGLEYEIDADNPLPGHAAVVRVHARRARRHSPT
jgi:sugar phosphate isomerase/epimerase